MNHQEGICKNNSKTSNLTRSRMGLRSLLGLRCLIFNLGVGPPGSGMFHVTEAGHANLCSVVGSFNGEEGTPEEPQRDLPMPLSHPRPSSVLQKKSRPLQTPFSPRFDSQTTRTLSRSRLRSEVLSPYPRPCCPVGLRGCASPPKRSQEQ